MPTSTPPIGRRTPSIGLVLALASLGLSPGCATMRRRAPADDLRPCDQGFATTADGWRLGIRHVRPEAPDPRKDPVVLCHGLGLNGTFWSITDHHLPEQLARAGYDVFIPDMRGSGASRRDGRVGRVNSWLRETCLPEIGGGDWTMDDQALLDVPAILDHVERVTGKPRVNWVGHSLGGMLMFAHLERTDRPDRIATFVGMGCSTDLTTYPQSKMLRANGGLRNLSRVLSTSRIARPMMWFRPPGMGAIDKFYYTAENVDRRTVSRFYGYTLEDLSAGALRQMAPYLRDGRLLSADGSIDYASGLGAIETPTLLIAGDGDIMVDVPSVQRTFDGLGSRDKTLLRFGRRQGHLDDYGHCDLVWSRQAPDEVFPTIIAWLDERTPERPSPQVGVAR